MVQISSEYWKFITEISASRRIEVNLTRWSVNADQSLTEEIMLNHIENTRFR